MIKTGSLPPLQGRYHLRHKTKTWWSVTALAALKHAWVPGSRGSQAPTLLQLLYLSGTLGNSGRYSLGQASGNTAP